jgi:hypothetical protein
MQPFVSLCLFVLEQITQGVSTGAIQVGVQPHVAANSWCEITAVDTPQGSDLGVPALTTDFTVIVTSAAVKAYRMFGHD